MSFSSLKLTEEYLEQQMYMNELQTISSFTITYIYRVGKHNYYYYLHNSYLIVHFDYNITVAITIYIDLF